jgi:prepilin-type N-terminal cleavage/methylation domain-containing protein
MTSIIRPSQPSSTARSPRDRGFTLIELLLAITLVGVIGTVVASMVVVTLRTNPLTEQRTDIARTLQGLVTWLPQDVDSTPPTGFGLDPDSPSGCTDSEGSNLLLLQWTERIGNVTTNYVANYRHVTDPAGSSFIHRITCRGTGAKPWGNTVTAQASAALPDLPPSWSPGELPFKVEIFRELDNDVSLVVVQVQTLDGSILTVDSAPKNPAHSLPPVTSTTTTTVPGATTTVAATTTTVAGTTTTAANTTTTTTPPCQIVSSTYPSSVFNTDPNGNGRSSTNVGVLQTALTVSVVTNGYCAGLEARPNTGAPNSELFRNFTTTNGVNYTVTFPGYSQGSSELWRDGNRTIDLYTPSGGPYATFTVQVK